MATGKHSTGQIAAAIVIACALTTSINAAAQTAPSTASADASRATVESVASRALSGAQDLTSFALGLIGVNYKFGGTTPEGGLDCSGLVRYVFQQVTGVTLPRTAKDLAQVGDKVAPDDLLPGDLVFFNTRRFAFSHVGIYLGDNRFIHAPRRGREVEVATLDRQYWQKHFNGARRLAGVLPGLLPDIVSNAVAAEVVDPVSEPDSADLP